MDPLNIDDLHNRIKELEEENATLAKSKEEYFDRTIKAEADLSILKRGVIALISALGKSL